jgi:hypothetical protein
MITNAVTLYGALLNREASRRPGADGWLRRSPTSPTKLLVVSGTEVEQTQSTASAATPTVVAGFPRGSQRPRRDRDHRNIDRLRGFGRFQRNEREHRFR